MKSQSRTPLCGRCNNHNVKSVLKGHKRLCPFRTCTCSKCALIDQRKKLNAARIFLQQRQATSKLCSPAIEQHNGRVLHGSNHMETRLPEVAPHIQQETGISDGLHSYPLSGALTNSLSSLSTLLSPPSTILSNSSLSTTLTSPLTTLSSAIPNTSQRTSEPQLWRPTDVVSSEPRPNEPRFIPPQLSYPMVPPQTLLNPPSTISSTSSLPPTMLTSPLATTLSSPLATTLTSPLATTLTNPLATTLTSSLATLSNAIPSASQRSSEPQLWRPTNVVSTEQRSNEFIAPLPASTLPVTTQSISTTLSSSLGSLPTTMVAPHSIFNPPSTITSTPYLPYLSTVLPSPFLYPQINALSEQDPALYYYY